MHSLPQDRIGVPYVHDCHYLYRPVNQSDVKAFRFTVGGAAAVHTVHVLEPGHSQHTR